MRSTLTRSGGTRVASRPSKVVREPTRAENEGEGSNIKVVVRCRGRNDKELKAKSRVVVDTSMSKTEVAVRVGPPDAATTKTYTVDQVFGPEADQSIVFEEVVAPVIDDVLQGMNCTVFAYGQTGTGKTYTMSGDDSITEYNTCAHEAGIIPRVLFKLFNELNSKGYDHSVSCSFVELYNEELRDLLDDDESKKVRIFDDASKRGVTLNGLSDCYITSAMSGLKVLQQGLQKRQVAATRINDLSSRSHSIFCINVSIDRDGGASGEFVTRGKINLVDLAGSENIGKSGAENKRAREAGMINQSLLTLGRVINSLVDRSPHTPYRESKLTRLLQDSLGGHTKTCIIATISPALVNIEESLSTLEYASRAKNIKNKPQLNGTVSKRTLLADYSSEMERLRLDLVATRKKNGVYLDPDHYNEVIADRESQRILLSEQQRRLETVERQLKSARDLIDSTNHDLLKKTTDLQSKTHSLSETLSSLASTEATLQSTRTALDNETTLRKAHASTEEQLQTVGGGLIQTLDETIEELNALHDKVQRKAMAQQDTKKAVNKSADELSSYAQYLERKLAEYGERQSDLANSLYQNILQLVTAETVRLTDTSSYLADSVSNLDMLKDEVMTTTAKSENDAKRILENSSKMRDELTVKIRTSMESLKGPMVKFWESMEMELLELKAHVRRPLEEILRDGQANCDAFKVYVQDRKEKLLTLKEDIASVSAQTTGDYDENIKRLQQAMNEERARSARERQQLVTHISQLLNDFSAGSDSRVADILNSTTMPMGHAANQLRQCTTDFGLTLDLLTTADDGFNQNMISNQERLRTQAQTIEDVVGLNGTKLELAMTKLQTDSSLQVESQMTSVDAGFKSLYKILTDNGEKSLDRNNTVEASVSKLCDAVRQTFKYLDGHLSHLRRNIGSLGNPQDTKAWSDSLATIWSSVEADSRKSLVKIRELIGDLQHIEYDDTPTGSTPKRRRIVFSRELPRTEDGYDVDLPSGGIRQPLEEISQSENVVPVEDVSERSTPLKRPAVLKKRMPIKRQA
jgi:kinesin family protein 11